MKKSACFLTFIFSILTVAGLTFAYEVPWDESRVKYFYIFGPQGDPMLGAEDSKQVLYILVPEREKVKLDLAVYDPDTGDSRDLKPSPDNPWDTVTEFAVYGRGDNLLEKAEFGESKEYDRIFYQFGPYPKEEGEKTGNFYRFKLVARALTGDDANLFKVRIYPKSAEAYSYDITFRLVEPQGEEMYFYPEIPADAGQIIVENYDIDPNGGTSRLYDPVYKKRYKLNDSASGQWTSTSVSLFAGQARRMKYILTKKTQKYAHAGIKVKDENGKLLPIYFRRGKVQVAALPPVELPKPKKEILDAKCNEFTFDATSSYDPDNQNLSFHWDFGDGTTGTEPVVTHVYKKGGEYTVTLTVKDDSGLKCDTSVVKQAIKVNTAPKPAFTAPDKGCVDHEIVFDASATSDEEQKDLTYLWDFGDGTTAEGKYVMKKYKKGGVYQVKLSVDDTQKTRCSVAVVQKAIKVNTPPKANAGGDVRLCLEPHQEYKVTFDGAGSRDTDGDALTYFWDFGDGTTAYEGKVTHVYKKAGSYTAKLIIDDGSGSACSSSADTVSVVLNKRPVAAAGEDFIYCVGTEAVFDGSSSYDEDGDRLTYYWDFGDGTTAEGIRVKHVYQKGGKYLAVLNVDDGKKTECSTARDSIVVNSNSRPSVSLKKFDSACVGIKVDFDASASSDADGDPLKYTWDFGDGDVIEDGPIVTHTYQKGGAYLVKVVVDDGRGTFCSHGTDALRIKVNTPPVADAGPNLVCCVNEESVFDGSGSYDADGDTLSYVWDFGDGTAASGAKVTHVYTKRGTYTVTVTVDDNSGTLCSSSVDTFMATAHEEPVAIIKIR